MTLLSKLLVQRALATNIVRKFRWDAKPDNIHSHSFRQGLRASAHYTFWILSGGMVLSCLNYAHFEEKFGFKFPKWIPGIDFLTDHLERAQAHNDKIENDSVPSSLAADVYDKYGAEGIDAMVKTWENQSNKQEEPSMNAIHAVMMAQAAGRYSEEVEQEADSLGLKHDEAGREIVRNSSNLSGKLGDLMAVKAEEATIAAAAIAGEVEEETGQLPGKEKVGFRDRKIIEYENRIRQYSTPDKVFRYFATYKLVDGAGKEKEVMMTPQDFLRSISPGEKQPEHLGLDQFLSISEAKVNSVTALEDLDPESVFYQLGAGGLISFSDYIFLLTVLSTSRRHFQIAFKMFDLNGDGNVDAEEFDRVTELMKQHSSTGARHRDHGNTGSSYKGVCSGLKTYFFGDDLQGNLTVDRFLEFQSSLQTEILALEFRRNDTNNSGRLAEKEFADLLIAYAGFQPNKRAKMLRRVRKTFDEETSPGVGLTDYLNFYQVLYSINEIDTALQFYHIAGAPIERHTMKHVAKTVAHVELSDHLVDVVFTLFDTDGDGKLSNKEFVSVMKQRAMRGLEKPKDMGISRIFSCAIKCANDCKPAIMGGVKKTE